MSVEQLEQDLQAINNERATLGERAKLVAKELDAARVSLELEADLAKLEKKHGVQLVRPEGIESAEAVNGQ